MTLQNGLPENFWDGKAVYLKGLHGWNPETWGCLSLTTKGRRDNIKKEAMKENESKFIVACYITGNKEKKYIRTKLVGLYVVSYVEGDREDFTAKEHHGRNPEQWKYALQATHAFSVVRPEDEIGVYKLYPHLKKGCRSHAGQCKKLDESEDIEKLKHFTYQEVPVFSGVSQGTGLVSSAQSSASFTRGVAARDVGYWVDPPECDQRKELYILRLEGNTDHYLGRPALGKRIYKLGFSADPQSRLDNFNLVLPKGSFRWELCRRTKDDGDDALYESHEAALAGENAMKAYLKDKCDPLGGEFFLSAPDLLDGAWAAGKRGTKGGG